MRQEAGEGGKTHWRSRWREDQVMKTLINISVPSSEAEETCLCVYLKVFFFLFVLLLFIRVKHLKILFTDWEQFANFSY